MFRAALKQVDREMMAMHEQAGLAAGFQNSQIVKATKLDIEVVEEITRELLQRGKLTLLHGGRMRHSEFRGGLSREDMRLVTLIEKMHTDELFKSPIKSEIVKELGKPEKKVKALLQWLIQMGSLVPLTPDLALHVDAVMEAERRLVRHVLKGGSVSPIEFKDIIGASRKYVIPLLEYFDKKGVTRREDNVRVLADGWQSKVYEETLEEQE